MASNLEKYSIATLLSVLLAACTLVHPAMGQSALTQPQGSQTTSTAKPVPLPHLYWHFLIYQNFLDGKAAAEVAQGKDGSWLRNHLQIKLGFNDADYAVIRTSSGRLAAEVQALDSQAKAIKSAGGATSQLQALAAQRETEINAEVAFLKQSLPPYKIKIFEAFLTQFFSPANMVRQPHSTQQPAVVQ